MVKLILSVVGLLTLFLPSSLAAKPFQDIKPKAIKRDKLKPQIKAIIESPKVPQQLKEAPQQLKEKADKLKPQIKAMIESQSKQLKETVNSIEAKNAPSNQIKSIPDAYNWYVRQCTENPFVTKSVSAAIVMSIGDIMAQTLEASMASKKFLLNKSRLVTFALCGLCYSGPFVHSWYEFLWKIGKWMETNYKSSKRSQLVVQLLTDQTLGVFIFFPLFFYVYDYIESLVLWRSPSFSRAHTKCMNEIKQVVSMQYRVFPMVNAINFAIVPVSLRVLFTNFVSVFWNMYLCTIIAGNSPE